MWSMKHPNRELTEGFLFLVDNMKVIQVILCNYTGLHQPRRHTYLFQISGLLLIKEIRQRKKEAPQSSTFFAVIRCYCSRSNVGHACFYSQRSSVCAICVKWRIQMQSSPKLRQVDIIAEALATHVHRQVSK